jgi:hypothetical protein
LGLILLLLLVRIIRHIIIVYDFSSIKESLDYFFRFSRLSLFESLWVIFRLKKACSIRIIIKARKFRNYFSTFFIDNLFFGLFFFLFLKILLDVFKHLSKSCSFCLFIYFSLRLHRRFSKVIKQYSNKQFQ